MSNRVVDLCLKLWEDRGSFAFCAAVMHWMEVKQEMDLELWAEWVFSHT